MHMWWSLPSVPLNTLQSCTYHILLWLWCKATRWKTFQLSCTSSSIYVSFSGSFQFSSVAQSCLNLRDPMAVLAGGFLKECMRLSQEWFPLTSRSPKHLKSGFPRSQWHCLAKVSYENRICTRFACISDSFWWFHFRKPRGLFGLFVCVFLFVLFSFLVVYCLHFLLIHWNSDMGSHHKLSWCSSHIYWRVHSFQIKLRWSQWKVKPLLKTTMKIKS